MAELSWAPERQEQMKSPHPEHPPWAMIGGRNTRLYLNHKVYVLLVYPTLMSIKCELLGLSYSEVEDVDNNLGPKNSIPTEPRENMSAKNV